MQNSGSVHQLLSSQSSRLEALRKRHSHISDRIEEAHRRPSTTDFYLRQLKKEKLMLKEQIEGLCVSSAASA